MNKKITRWSLMNILFAILVSIPLWSIVVRTGYVLLNKNAYQSYYGETINDNTLVNERDLQINENYEFIISNFNPQYDYQYNVVFYVNNITNRKNNTTYGYGRIEIYNSTLTNGVYIYNRLVYTSNDNTQTFTNFFPDGIDIIFNLATERVGNNNNLAIYDYFYKRVYNKYSYLDNVFDYSIDKFNSENDAHFDFVSTIANMFITEDSYGWRYVEFVNWYFNYFIVISAVYILFLAIIWFIAVSRHLIERSMHLW